MPLKKPQSYFTERETLRNEAALAKQRKLQEVEDSKRLRSPKKALGELAGSEPVFSNRKPRRNIAETVQDIVEKIDDIDDSTPDNKEILDRLSAIEGAITSLHIEKMDRAGTLSLYESIEALRDIVNDIVIPEQKEYDEEITLLDSKLQEATSQIVEDSVKTSDEIKEQVSSNYRKLNDEIIKNRSTYESVKVKIDSLVIPDLKNSESQISELRSIQKELKEAIDEIPNQNSRFDPSDILESLTSLRENISLSFDRCNELDKKYDRIPGVKDYTEDLDLLQEFIVDVKQSIKYYDTDVDELKSSIVDLGKHMGKTISEKVRDMHDDLRIEDRKIINTLNKKIGEIPEVKYYDEEIELIEEKINNLLNSINDIPEVKSYDKDIRKISKTIDKLQEKVNSIKIVDWKPTIDKIQEDVVAMQRITEEYDQKISLVEEAVTDPYGPDALKDYVTFDKMQQHYRGFINRIQQQLASLGGGGAVRILDMDDLDEDVRRNPQDYDGEFLRLEYDPVTKITTFVADGGNTGGGGPIVNPDMGDLEDVNTDGVADGYILVYIASTGEWEAKPVQYIGVNIDANPDREIQDYGDYSFGT